MDRGRTPSIDDDRADEAEMLAEATTGRQSRSGHDADGAEEQREGDPKGQRASHDTDREPALAAEPAGGELHRHRIGRGEGRAGQESEREGRGQVRRDEREAEIGDARAKRAAARTSAGRG